MTSIDERKFMIIHNSHLYDLPKRKHIMYIIKLYIDNDEQKIKTTISETAHGTYIDLNNLPDDVINNIYSYVNSGTK